MCFPNLKLLARCAQFLQPPNAWFVGPCRDKKSSLRHCSPYTWDLNCSAFSLARCSRRTTEHKGWDLETEVKERKRLKVASHHQEPLWAHLWSKQPQSLVDGGSTWRAGEAARLWSYSKTSCTAKTKRGQRQFNTLWPALIYYLCFIDL